MDWVARLLEFRAEDVAAFGAILLMLLILGVPCTRSDR